MKGRLLLLDAIATNRISLQAMLDPACYLIEELGSISAALDAVRKCRPELILTAWSLPDGTAADLRKALHTLGPGADIPVVAMARKGEKTNRRQALQAGLADLLIFPISETMLHAKLRSLLRSSHLNSGYEYSLPGQLPPQVETGFAEAAAQFGRTDRIAVLAKDRRIALDWGDQLGTALNHPVATFDLNQRQAVLAADPPMDAVVVALAGATSDPALRLLSDLRARTNTQHAAVIAVPETGDTQSAAHALDLGADDVMTGPIDMDELALRVKAQLRRKHLSDRLRLTVQDGLRAALIDTMTGLYNRRYAIPHLSYTIRRSARSGNSFAVMMADMDHFKRINDNHGHLAGDQVLIEAAQRLRDALEPQDLIARIGGEEFLIVLHDTDATAAHDVADRLRRAVNTKAFAVSSSGAVESMTISIGVAVCSPPSNAEIEDRDPDDSQVAALMHDADVALYESKQAGRNKVTLACAAA